MLWPHVYDMFKEVKFMEINKQQQKQKISCEQEGIISRMQCL